MTVLAEQHVDRRRHLHPTPSARRGATGRTRATRERTQRRQIRQSDRHGRRGIPGLLLLLAAAALTVAIVLVVPRLQEYSQTVIDPDAVEIAAVDGLLGLFSMRPAEVSDANDASGANDRAAGSTPEIVSQPLVEFELTDDLEYVVSEGETLSEIALAHDVDYELLARFNGIGNPDSIRAGTRIVIPGTLTRGLGIAGESP